MCVRLTALALFSGAYMLSAETISGRLDRLESEVSAIKLFLQKLADDNPEKGSISLPPSSNPSAQSYEINSGDSYWSIARRYQTTVSALLEANRGIDPHRLAIGTKIKIPRDRVSQKSSQKTRTYRVKSGDILGRISINHKISLQQLLSANPGLNPKILKIGTILKIPGANSQSFVVPKIPLHPTQGTNPDLFKSNKFNQAEVRRSQGDDPKKPRLVVVEDDLRFFEIAERYGTTVEDLNNLNRRNLSAKQMIKSGSQLYIQSR